MSSSVKRFTLLLVFTVLYRAKSPAQVQFRQVNKNMIEARLKRFSDDNQEREVTIKQLFAESGCKDDKLSEQVVKSRLPPNVICMLPGTTSEEIVVGAHTDKVEKGDGVVDNWSGASLLSSLYFSLSAQPRKHTYVFIAFTAEEQGLVGSDYYTHHLTPQERSKIEAMVNMDTLGLGPTKVWASHADKDLLKALSATAAGLELPIAVVNVDHVGTTDSESFEEYKIPRITIHSLTQKTWPILHSPKDCMEAIKMDDYYDSYRLIAGYLAYLDSKLGQEAPQPAASK
jgi:putative aminopeptidase FrvX